MSSFKRKGLLIRAPEKKVDVSLAPVRSVSEDAKQDAFARKLAGRIARADIAHREKMANTKVH